MGYHCGDTVVFTDELGRKLVGTITKISVQENAVHLSIDAGSYGFYVREPKDVRLVQK